MPAAAVNPIDPLLAPLRNGARARSRAVAGWINVYLNTLPAEDRTGALAELIAIWTVHHQLWAERIDSGAAVALECCLTSFDWSETAAALRALQRDLSELADA